MSAAAVLIAIMSVSAIPVSADVSRVQYFTIQNNTACASSIRLTGLYFNVNNISNSSDSSNSLLIQKRRDFIYKSWNNDVYRLKKYTNSRN